MAYTNIRTGIPFVSETDYFTERGARNGMAGTRVPLAGLRGLGGLGVIGPAIVAGGITATLDQLFDTDEDAAMDELTGGGGGIAPGFKDTTAPPASTGGGTTTTTVPRPPVATGGGTAAPPVSMIGPAPGSSGGLSNAALAAVGVGAVLCVGALVWAKKTGKLGKRK